MRWRHDDYIDEEFGQPVVCVSCGREWNAGSRSVIISWHRLLVCETGNWTLPAWYDRELKPETIILMKCTIDDRQKKNRE